jgi:23S rRNA (uracil1939-C5)-methyltransferase
LLLAADSDPSRLGAVASVEALSGASCGTGDLSRSLVIAGEPVVRDRLAISDAPDAPTITLQRHAHSFFQGNRFLLQSLVNAVVDALPAGRILDLYAGVGLFAAAVAARGDAVVTAVEGDRSSARDLKVNAALLGPAVTPRQQPVEEFVATTRHRYDAVIVDPPRTGMSRAALAGAIALNAARVVYVSCDVATLARDARRLVDAGYRLTSMRAFDLFPNTAHVETLASFDR